MRSTHVTAVALKTVDHSLIHDPEQHFSRLYNRVSFMFAHALSGSGLFELDSLVALSRRRPTTSQFAYWSNGRVEVLDRWEKNTLGASSLEGTISGIENNSSLVMLKRVEQDPVFGSVLHEVMNEVQDLVGRTMRGDVIVGRATILIASPHRVTAYHIDADVNFLFQISGDKKISVFDHTNRAVLSDRELERYFAGDHNGARYDEAKQPFAKTYDLGAGFGVHIPCTAPHWAQNADDPSVALSINFDLRSMSRVGRIYRMNDKLRRWGASPLPPGTSAWRDRLKAASDGALTATMGLFR